MWMNFWKYVKVASEKFLEPRAMNFANVVLLYLKERSSCEIVKSWSKHSSIPNVVFTKHSNSASGIRLSGLNPRRGGHFFMKKLSYGRYEEIRSEDVFFVRNLSNYSSMFQNVKNNFMHYSHAHVKLMNHKLRRYIIQYMRNSYRSFYDPFQLIIR